jgi:hypothetical protein
LTLLGVLSSFVLQAQISGTVLDQNQSPLAYANVLLLQGADSAFVKGTIASEAGTYSLEDISEGRYLIQIQMGGYETFFSKAFSYSGTAKKLDNFQLTEKAVQLEEVQIQAIKPLFEQQIDRLVVNVDNTITNAGSTVLEVLERSPGVDVNRQSNSISMAGKDGVIVMINGKDNRMPLEAAMSLLNGLNSNSVEKIELITTPPANFEAEGNAGIINIVLKQNSNEGTNGSFSLSAGYWWGEKTGATFNINHRRKGVNLYANYSFNRNHKPQIFTNKRTLINDGKTTIFDTNSERDPVDWLNDLRFGVDINLGPKTILGGLLAAYNTTWDMIAYNNVTQEENGIPVSSIDIENGEINEWNHISGNLNLQHTFSKDQQLTLNADYLYTHDDNPTTYLNSYRDGDNNLLFEEEIRAGKITPINIYTAKMDYIQNLGEKVKWEAGLKASNAEFLNQVNIESLEQGQWVEDTFFTQDYTLMEVILGAYSSFDIKAGEKTSMKLGLRYEHTNSNLSSPEEPDIVDRQYGNLFPSLFISHKLNDNQGLNFSYSRRISRPAYNDLAPFVIFLDPNTYFSGNAALQPAITDAFKIDYRYKRVMFSVQYSYEDSSIARFQPIVNPESKIQIISAFNMDKVHTVSANLFFPVKVTENWNMQNSILFGWQQLNTFYNGIPGQFENVGVRINTTQSFGLPNDYAFEISGRYRSPGIYGIRRIRANGAVNLGFQKKLPNNQGVFRLTWNDIFFTSKFIYDTVVEDQDFSVTGGFSWNLGSSD